MWARSKGGGRIYQQTFIDTYSKVGFAKLYLEKTPITAADLPNDRVVHFFEEHGIRLSRILTDRGTDYCGVPDRHPYVLYLGIEDIEHRRTKTKSPQTDGICERFTITLLNSFIGWRFANGSLRAWTTCSAQRAGTTDCQVMS